MPLILWLRWFETRRFIQLRDLVQSTPELVLLAHAGLTAVQNYGALQNCGNKVGSVTDLRPSFLPG